MKKYYHRITVLFFTLTILLLITVGFFMCYSDGTFTFGPVRIVLVEQTQDVIVTKKPSKIEIPIKPSNSIFINQNGVSNRIRHWDTKTHEYTADNSTQFIYTVSQKTAPSVAKATEGTNTYVTPMGHSTQVIFDTYVYESIVQQIEHTLSQATDTPVTYAITYEYKKPDDMKPTYVRFEVYTPNDNGNTINWNLLVYNDTPK